VRADRERGKPLGEYRSKRDFSVTPEPEGSKRPSRTAKSMRFVVQRHRARRLHYDFRLEVGGVLASWAMPKGPTLDPAVRRLAVHVEDHPVEYRDFEGVIPAGGYGAGDVIVWDRGTWELTKGDDAAAAIDDGEVHFSLAGEKLRGHFVLVRTRRRQGTQEQWLMLHKRDDDARDGWSAEDEPRSVKSGRTNEEVAADPEALWRGDLPPEEAEKRVESPSSRWKSATKAELAQLEELGDGGRWELQGRELKLTNLDKELFPGRDAEEPVTKRELVRYYASVAPVMLPYLADRPVNMHRYPDGSERPGFWHKEVPKYAPQWLTRWRYEGARPGKSEVYAIVDTPPSLAWMANYGAVELHPWTSAATDVQKPTWALIDIDPGTRTTFAEVVLLARLYRSALDHLGVLAMPKLTGRRGIHIFVPIEPRYTFDETRAWVERLSRVVGATVPDLISWTWQKSARHGLARLDFTQNALNKTLVAPYSVRAAPGAPVSAPVEWDELDDPDMKGDAFTVRSVPDRISRSGDPFRRLLGHAQHLPDI
jgi:bifunctional non-homologous end joining protein LigD